MRKKIVYHFWLLSKFFSKIYLIPISIIIQILIRLIFSAHIPYKLNLGKGTTFPHMALGVVISSRALIGKNCTIHQNVTIGERMFGDNGVPQIGDNVFIGSNSVVFGRIVIGDNVIIGAGTIVNKDVPSNCVVVGNPMRIIKKSENGET